MGRAAVNLVPRLPANEFLTFILTTSLVGICALGPCHNTNPVANHGSFLILLAFYRPLLTLTVISTVYHETVRAPS